HPAAPVFHGPGRGSGEPGRGSGHGRFRRAADGPVPGEALGHAVRAAVGLVGRGPHLPGRAVDAGAGRRIRLAGFLRPDRGDCPAGAGPAVVDAWTGAGTGRFEIGRASCRERVDSWWERVVV